MFSPTCSIFWGSFENTVYVLLGSDKLFCFHVKEELYQCRTLNFGARASGWYWGRVGGLMVRSAHALLDHHHAEVYPHVDPSNPFELAQGVPGT